MCNQNQCLTLKGLPLDVHHQIPAEVSRRLKEDLPKALKQFAHHDLRWSYLAMGVMVLAGTIINLLLPHGWTVWPFVLAAAIMLFINEVAERNGQGVPPLRVYAFVGGAVVAWMTIVLVLSALNPLVLLIGASILGYHGAKGYIKTRQRAQLIAKRRVDGCCIHCGAVADPQYAYCQNCGEDPDPDASLLKRVGTAPRGADVAAKARSALVPQSLSAAAAQKEQALLSRRRQKRGARR